jgi:hypothetical protein
MEHQRFTVAEASMAEADSTVASMAAVDGKLSVSLESGWQRRLPAVFFL